MSKLNLHISSVLSSPEKRELIEKYKDQLCEYISFMYSLEVKYNVPCPKYDVIGFHCSPYINALEEVESLEEQEKIIIVSIRISYGYLGSETEKFKIPKHHLEICSTAKGKKEIEKDYFNHRVLPILQAAIKKYEEAKEKLEKRIEKYTEYVKD